MPSRCNLMNDSSEKMTALVQFAGTVAHELNNIFTAVNGNLSLLRQELETDPQQASTIRDVVRAAQRGIDLTAKLQAFAGRQRLERRPIDINRVISRTMRGLEPMLGSAMTQITLADEELVVYADEGKFTDTIAELVKNARAAMPPLGGRLTIETLRGEDERRRPCAVLRIADNGRGMAPEVMERAVEPLFTTNPYGIQTGWGLSNCAGFIRQCGGKLTLSSELGQGTVVEICLPLDTD